MPAPIGSASNISIRPAQRPADEAVAKALLRRYAEFLLSGPGGSGPIIVDDFHQEIERLADFWIAPNGVLLLAFLDEQAAGCVAVRACSDRPACSEMKRLWVEPWARRQGLGRSLVSEAVAWSRRRGDTTMLLDTVTCAMPEAGALYRSLGFVTVDRYNNNPVPGLSFLQLDLSTKDKPRSPRQHVVGNE